MARVLNFGRAKHDDHAVSYSIVRSTMTGEFKFLGRAKHDTGISGFYRIVRNTMARA